MRKFFYRFNSIAKVSIILALLLFITLLTLSCKRENSNNTNNNAPAQSIMSYGENNFESERTAHISESYNSKNISKDPFLLYFLRNLPAIKIDKSENVVIQQIWYKDFDTKEIDYGDYDYDVLPYTMYLFQNNAFYGIAQGVTESGKITRQAITIEIVRDAEGNVNNLNQYDFTGYLVQQQPFKKMITLLPLMKSYVVFQ
jgi:hypothetical protein